MNIEQYKSIKGFSEFILKEKSSEFIAHSYPVETEEEFLNLLNETRKKFYDATHHCYGIKLINGYLKFSDDGEPGGTAGARILNAIDHYELNNIAVIVIRYFGGTKLGVGPLGKAYYNSAAMCLGSAKKIIKKLYHKFFIHSDFEMISHVYRYLENHHAKILKTDYSSEVKLECLILPGHVHKIEEQLLAISK